MATLCCPYLAMSLGHLQLHLCQESAFHWGSWELDEALEGLMDNGKMGWDGPGSPQGRHFYPSPEQGAVIQGDSGVTQRCGSQVDIRAVVGAALKVGLRDAVSGL